MNPASQESGFRLCITRSISLWLCHLLLPPRAPVMQWVGSWVSNLNPFFGTEHSVTIALSNSVKNWNLATNVLQSVWFKSKCYICIILVSLVQYPHHNQNFLNNTQKVGRVGKQWRCFSCLSSNAVLMLLLKWYCCIFFTVNYKSAKDNFCGLSWLLPKFVKISKTIC